MNRIVATTFQRATAPEQGDRFRRKASMLERITIAAWRTALILQSQNGSREIFVRVVFTRFSA
jgi:hypothetical protein